MQSQTNQSQENEKQIQRNFNPEISEENFDREEADDASEPGIEENSDTVDDQYGKYHSGL